MRLTIKRSWLTTMTMMTMVSLFSLSCDKQPIGPEAPDPLGPPPPGMYINLIDFRAVYTGGGADQTIPAGTKKLRGVVISSSGNEAAGNYRLQDESGGGLYFYSVAGSPIYSQGTVLEIDAAGAGVYTVWNGDLELKSVPQTKVIQLSGTFTVEPRVATIQQIITNRAAWASSLVKIENVTSITQASSNSTGVTYNIVDATGTLSMFVRNVSNITVNTSAKTITGYVSLFNATTQIGIRSASDLQ